MKPCCSVLLTPWVYRYPIGILFLRVCVSCMMLTHGIPKVVMLCRGQGAGWLDPLGVGATLSLALCAFAECVCSLALLVGFLSRLAALVLVFNFWVVVFVFERDASWQQVELPLLYLVCFGTLLCTGSGCFSVDRLIARRLGNCGAYGNQKSSSAGSSAPSANNS